MTISISSDQITLSRIHAIQQLHIRDIPKYYISFTSLWMGFLHYEFAVVDVVKCYSNRVSERNDPEPMSTFVWLLGRIDILDLKLNYSATHHLYEEMSEAYSLSTFFAMT